MFSSKKNNNNKRRKHVKPILIIKSILSYLPLPLGEKTCTSTILTIEIYFRKKLSIKKKKKDGKARLPSTTATDDVLLWKSQCVGIYRGSNSAGIHVYIDELVILRILRHPRVLSSMRPPIFVLIFSRSINNTSAYCDVTPYYILKTRSTAVLDSSSNRTRSAKITPGRHFKFSALPGPIRKLRVDFTKSILSSGLYNFRLTHK